MCFLLFTPLTNPEDVPHGASEHTHTHCLTLSHTPFLSSVLLPLCFEALTSPSFYYFFNFNLKTKPNQACRLTLQYRTLLFLFSGLGLPHGDRLLPFLCGHVGRLSQITACVVCLAGAAHVPVNNAAKVCVCVPIRFSLLGLFG